jgi:hypothetical protein
MILTLIMLIIGWFVAGAVVNFIFYYNIPVDKRGSNDSVKAIHIILNIVALIAFFKIIF